MLMAAFALLATGSAFAQFANSTGGAKKTSTTANTSEWSSVYLQWNPSNFVTDVKGADDQSFTAFTLGFNKAFSILQDKPLFVEVGGAVQYSFYSEDNKEWKDEDDWEDHLYHLFGKEYEDYDMPKDKFGMLSLKVPVSLTYNWQATDNIVIAPYAGLTVRFNLVGSMWTKYDDGFIDDVNENGRSSYYDPGYYEKMEESKNIFDKDDMGDKDATANRFQLGWQIGVNFKFNNKWYLGAAYGADFSEFSKKTKISQPSITAGLLF